MMQMHVRVDAARHDDAAARVDHPPGRLCGQRAGSGQCRDGLPGNRHIALNDALGRDHLTIANNRIEHPASRRSESWLGLSRPSTSFQLKLRKKDVDARDKRGHDAGEVIQSHRNAL